MSYVTKVLQGGESVIATGHLHWIGYWRSFVCIALAVATRGIPAPDAGLRFVVDLVAVGLVIFGLVFGLHTAWLRWGTEIGVTNRRVIYKRGILSRRTAEMNMDKIETVLIDQSLLGRLLGFGAISIRGSGASIETLPHIAKPIALRSAIIAR